MKQKTEFKACIEAIKKINSKNHVPDLENILDAFDSLDSNNFPKVKDAFEWAYIQYSARVENRILNNENPVVIYRTRNYAIWQEKAKKRLEMAEERYG